MKFVSKLALYASLISLVQATPSASTKDLLKGIETTNIALVKEALAQGADANYVNSDQNDLSNSCWTPSMKAIARLGGSIVTTQSIFNSVYALKGYGVFAGIAGSAIIAALKKSWYMFPIGFGMVGSLEYFIDISVSKIDKQKIRDQFEIAKLLIEKENKLWLANNNVCNASLVDEALGLMHSPNLCPPYDNRYLNAEYKEMLQTLHRMVPHQNWYQVWHMRKDSKPPMISTLLYNDDVEQNSSFQPTTPVATKLNTFKQIDIQGKVPFVFHPHYDISFAGLEKLHPFDTKKYSKIAQYLIKNLKLSKDQFYTPIMISDEDMLLVHTKEYSNSLQSSWKLGLIADMPLLGLLPNKVVQKALLNPVKLATGGTVLATQLALEYGWAINLSGGYHHAKAAEPVLGGFCIINDICIATKKILLQHPEFRILIVDLDAHQGNGIEDILKNEPNVAIFDMFNALTWPGDYACQERINFRFPLKSRTDDKEYLRILSNALPCAIDSVKPDLIIYNAGTDIYEKDPIGALSVSKQGIIDRDQFVFEQAIHRNIPIVMTLSGGYHADSHAIVSESIENLWYNDVLKK